MLTRAMVIQRKTQRPVQFELTEDTRNAVAAWIAKANLKPEPFNVELGGRGLLRSPAWQG
jgi:hypothetical protein